MTPGTYRTAAGSTVTLSGSRGLHESIDFDWLEEGACVEAMPFVDRDNMMLCWSCQYPCCEYDGGCGEVKLEKVML